MELNSEFTVEEGGQRLDVWLASNLPAWTRSQIKLQIDGGGVSVNNSIVTKAGYFLKEGDNITLRFVLHQISASPEDIKLDIIYEDDDIAIINKPQGMVVHPAPGTANHTLVNALLYHLNSISEGSDKTRPGIVHRIDKDTSGLLVVAKNNQAHMDLANQIAQHSAYRQYLALLEGNLKSDEGTITTNIGRDPLDRKKMAVVLEGGKSAVTHYRVVDRFIGYTLTEFKLETGRTHQIRVHAKYIGHPVVGDKTYGYSKQKFNLSGQLLHAYKLELTHPKTKQRMTFTCPLPDYFTAVIKKLKKV